MLPLIFYDFQNVGAMDVVPGGKQPLMHLPTGDEEVLTQERRRMIRAGRWLCTRARILAGDSRPLELPWRHQFMFYT